MNSLQPDGWDICEIISSLHILCIKPFLCHPLYSEGYGYRLVLNHKLAAWIWKIAFSIKPATIVTGILAPLVRYSMTGSSEHLSRTSHYFSLDFVLKPSLSFSAFYLNKQDHNLFGAYSFQVNKHHIFLCFANSKASSFILKLRRDASRCLHCGMIQGNRTGVPLTGT